MQRPKVTLTVIEGTSVGKKYVFEELAHVLVGRASECDICLAPYLNIDVSRHHCLFIVDPPAISVSDLGSKNGTFVNGVKVGQRLAHQPADEADLRESPPLVLADGDEVRIGGTILRVGIRAAVARPELVGFPSFGWLWSSSPATGTYG